jgi:hypothetical protein
MAWLAVNEVGVETIHDYSPIRGAGFWYAYQDSVSLPKGTIKHLIGNQLLKTHGRDHLIWEDEPVKFSEVME